MSLIPSESLNFPDSFRANVGWRISEQTDDEESPDSSSHRAVVFPSTEARPATHSDAPLNNPVDTQVPENVPASTVADASATGELTHPAAPSANGDSQPELIPQTEGDAGGLETLSASAEMRALLAHFLSSGSAISSNPPAPHPPPSAHETAGSDFKLVDLPQVTPQPIAVPNESTALPEIQTETITPSPGSNVTAEEKGVESGHDLHEATAPESESSGTEMTAPAVPLVIETPAQASHILELIAAAVQRGTLVGEPVVESAPAAAQNPMPPTTPPEIAPTPVEYPRHGEESAEPAIPSSPPAAIPAVKTTPARIRITPRKLKPRAQVEATAQAAVPSPALTSGTPALIPNEATTADSEIKHAPRQNLKPDTAHATSVTNEARRRVEPKQSSARKIASVRPELPRSDLLMSDARERRNRWIGFGLSELAALTSLLLLGHYGLTHHFPDPTLKLLVFILVFAAALIAVALPIAFLRNDPARWQRQR